MEDLHPPAGHTARILDGKALAGRIRAGLKQRVEEGVAAGRPRPGLATLLVGDDPASRIYVRSKLRACETAGLASFHRLLPGNASGEEVLAQVRTWNEDSAVHGILVQLPLPGGIDSQAVLECIRPAKDVDGFHPVNQGRLLQGLPGLRPCTPKGILRLLEEAAVLVGRSNIVGKPVALMLLERHATVTLCHSRTPDLAAEVGRADVVVAAAGRAGLVRSAWIRPGAAVIDVG
ncbi:MAG: bifunctional 5,10-methylenetetrahydrofolate dehydrogenase/5,10-methenyltetrahydrofolate cyclohydrolase, partial [Planctomycetota bacterium]